MVYDLRDEKVDSLKQIFFMFSVLSRCYNVERFDK